MSLHIAGNEPVDVDIRTDNMNEDNIILYKGCLCCNIGFLCDGTCIGFSSEAELCCILEQCCLKVGQKPYTCSPKEDDNLMCQLGFGCCALHGLKAPTTCWKSQSQFCCLVQSAAFPPDKEIIATCAFCGLACYPAFGCCKRLGELKEVREGGAPPAVTSMER